MKRFVLITVVLSLIFTSTSALAHHKKGHQELDPFHFADKIDCGRLDEYLAKKRKELKNAQEERDILKVIDLKKDIQQAEYLFEVVCVRV